MPITIAALYRYPVKGLSAEMLARVELAPRQCLPQDRRFAITLGTTEFDPQHPKWLAKTHFVMLMRDEKLAQLGTRFDARTGVLEAVLDGRVVLREAITEPPGRDRAGRFFTDFLGGSVTGPLRLIEAPGHAFADARPKPNATTDKYVSLINLASLAALDQAVGQPVDRLRFRANVYLAGASAWDELDWLEREISLGAARLRVIAPITRCAATEVNPATARRDRDIVGELQRHFGHNLMGVYAEVVEGGTILLGDGLRIPA